MEKEILEKANILNDRIKRLETLKMYLDCDDNHYWWYDFLRLVLPEKYYNKLECNIKYDTNEIVSYDKMFINDVMEFLDKSIEKYKSELKRI